MADDLLAWIFVGVDLKKNTVRASTLPRISLRRMVENSITTLGVVTQA
jgi:hypothetical protein